MTLSLAAIAERLQGYDPQALAASDVNLFLAEMVSPVTEIDTRGAAEMAV